MARIHEIPESNAWVTDLDHYEIGGHYFSQSHGEIEFLGEAKDPRSKEHVAIFRSATSGGLTVVKVDCDRPITIAEHIDRESERWLEANG